ncbi:MAG: hypothetical protein EYC70_08870 [Planctomycetota bacterium]|nr:MAG: hypothetical protein EYC70_08870 [Planctomycetota bacterium]
MRDREARELASGFREALPADVHARLAALNARGCGLFLGAALNQAAAREASARLWRRGERVGPLEGELRLALLLAENGEGRLLSTRAMFAPGACEPLDALQSCHLRSGAFDPESAALFEELVDALTMQLPFRLPGMKSSRPQTGDQI